MDIFYTVCGHEKTLHSNISPVTTEENMEEQNRSELMKKTLRRPAAL
jgi:hypothetical protein